MHTRCADTGQGREQWERAGWVIPPHWAARSWRWDGTPQVLTTEGKHSPHGGHPSLGVVCCFATGNGQWTCPPEPTALAPQVFTGAMAQAGLGSRSRKEIHSRPSLGHQLRRLCAKLLIVRARPPFPTGLAQGRHCSRSDLASEEKILQYDCGQTFSLV